MADVDTDVYYVDVTKSLIASRKYNHKTADKILDLLRSKTKIPNNENYKVIAGKKVIISKFTSLPNNFSKAYKYYYSDRIKNRKRVSLRDFQNERAKNENLALSKGYFYEVEDTENDNQLLNLKLYFDTSEGEINSTTLYPSLNKGNLLWYNVISKWLVDNSVSPCVELPIFENLIDDTPVDLKKERRFTRGVNSPNSSTNLLSAYFVVLPVTGPTLHEWLDKGNQYTKLDLFDLMKQLDMMQSIFNYIGIAHGFLTPDTVKIIDLGQTYHFSFDFSDAIDSEHVFEDDKKDSPKAIFFSTNYLIVPTQFDNLAIIKDGYMYKFLKASETGIEGYEVIDDKYSIIDYCTFYTSLLYLLIQRNNENDSTYEDFKNYLMGTILAPLINLNKTYPFGLNNFFKIDQAIEAFNQQTQVAPEPSIEFIEPIEPIETTETTESTELSMAGEYDTVVYHQPGMIAYQGNLGNQMQSNTTPYANQVLTSESMMYNPALIPANLYARPLTGEQSFNAGFNLPSTKSLITGVLGAGLATGVGLMALGRFSDTGILNSAQRGVEEVKKGYNYVFGPTDLPVIKAQLESELITLRIRGNKESKQLYVNYIKKVIAYITSSLQLGSALSSEDNEYIRKLWLETVFTIGNSNSSDSYVSCDLEKSNDDNDRKLFDDLLRLKNTLKIGIFVDHKSIGDNNVKFGLLCAINALELDDNKLELLSNGTLNSIVISNNDLGAINNYNVFLKTIRKLSSSDELFRLLVNILHDSMFEIYMNELYNLPMNSNFFTKLRASIVNKYMAARTREEKSEIIIMAKAYNKLIELVNVIRNQTYTSKLPIVTQTYQAEYRNYYRIPAIPAANAVPVYAADTNGPNIIASILATEASVEASKNNVSKGDYLLYKLCNEIQYTLVPLTADQRNTARNPIPTIININTVDNVTTLSFGESQPSQLSQASQSSQSSLVNKSLAPFIPNNSVTPYWVTEPKYVLNNKYLLMPDGKFIYYINGQPSYFNSNKVEYDIQNNCSIYLFAVGNYFLVDLQVNMILLPFVENTISGVTGSSLTASPTPVIIKRDGTWYTENQTHPYILSAHIVHDANSWYYYIFFPMGRYQVLKTSFSDSFKSFIDLNFTLPDNKEIIKLKSVGTYESSSNTVPTEVVKPGRYSITFQNTERKYFITKTTWPGEILPPENIETTIGSVRYSFNNLGQYVTDKPLNTLPCVLILRYSEKNKFEETDSFNALIFIILGRDRKYWVVRKKNAGFENRLGWDSDEKIEYDLHMAGDNTDDENKKWIGGNFNPLNWVDSYIAHLGDQTAEQSEKVATKTLESGANYFLNNVPGLRTGITGVSNVAGVVKSIVSNKNVQYAAGTAAAIGGAYIAKSMYDYFTQPGKGGLQVQQFSDEFVGNYKILDMYKAIPADKLSEFPSLLSKYNQNPLTINFIYNLSSSKRTLDPLYQQSIAFEQFSISFDKISTLNNLVQKYN